MPLAGAPAAVPAPLAAQRQADLAAPEQQARPRVHVHRHVVELVGAVVAPVDAGAEDEAGQGALDQLQVQRAPVLAGRGHHHADAGGLAALLLQGVGEHHAGELRQGEGDGAGAGARC